MSNKRYLPSAYIHNHNCNLDDNHGREALAAIVGAPSMIHFSSLIYFLPKPWCMHELIRIR